MAEDAAMFRVHLSNGETLDVIEYEGWDRLLASLVIDDDQRVTPSRPWLFTTSRDALINPRHVVWIERTTALDKAD
jgi:hypothetical protein